MLYICNQIYSIMDMKRIIIGLMFLLLSAQFGMAQVKLSDYKYVIVEKQFHFQNEADEYDLNRLVKFLFEKQGFDAILEGEPLPDDVKANYCLAMTSELKATGALKTKAMVILRDCDNNVVFTSEEGITKIKEFDRAYEMAIRKTFESFAEIDYYYVPSERVIAKGKDSDDSDAQKEEIVKLKAEIETLKSESEAEEQKVDEEVEKAEATVETVSNPAKMTFFAKKEASSGNYQVFDKDNKQMMVLMSSGREGLFMVKDANAVVYKEDGKWYLSENVDGQQVIKEIELQF